MERLGEMVIVTDLSRRITYANPAAEKILGYTPRELIGRRARDIFDNIPGPPPDLSRWINEQHEKEVWHKKKDGTVFPTMMNGTVIEDEEGEPLFISATAVLCSGYITDPIVTSYREHGFDSILPNPFPREELKKVLDELIGDHSDSC